MKLKSGPFLAIMSLAAGIILAGDIRGTVTTKGVRDSRDVVVYLREVKGEFPAPGEHAMIDQKDLTFIPHIRPVIAGTTVDFHNSDDVLHNVFSPDICAEKFNLGTWPKGEKRSFQFKETGCFSVMLCNVHPEMEAWVMVLQNPYYYLTGKDGVYTIKDVPPGTYTLVAWHERLKAREQTVEVKASGELVVDFTLSRR